MSQRTVRIPDSHQIEIQWGVPRDPAYPPDSQLTEWVIGALTRLDSPPSEVSVRMMSADEISELNLRYRGKSGPTNVLSFPADAETDGGIRMLGDIAICTQVVEDEAAAQGKTVRAHLAHMLVHGVLHLSGYDHIEDEEAQKMEQIEAEIVADFGFPDPYEVHLEDPVKEEDSNNE